MTLDTTTNVTADDTLWRITTRGYVAALITHDNLVVQAAPILRRYVGMHWAKAKHELRRLNADIENLSGGFDHDVDTDHNS